MATCAFFGFYYKGQFYVVFHHWMAYPSDFGATIIQQIKEAIDDGKFVIWRKLLDNMKVFDDSKIPTKEQIEKYCEEKNINIDTLDDLYCWSDILDVPWSYDHFEDFINYGYMINHVDRNGFPKQEDYGYVINYDDDVFDLYQCNEKYKSYNWDELPDLTKKNW